MLSLKTNGLDKHAKGMSLHLGYFDTASYSRLITFNRFVDCNNQMNVVRHDNEIQ